MTLYFRDFATSVQTESLYFRDFFDKSITEYLPGHLANVTVGHLPQEISRLMRFLSMRGACNRKRCAVPMIAPHPRRPRNPRNHHIQAVARFKSLIELSYQEPVNGNFNDCTSEITFLINRKSYTIVNMDFVKIIPLSFLKPLKLMITLLGYSLILKKLLIP